MLDLATLRTEAEHLLTDRCTIERRTGETLDATLNRVDVWTVVLADLPCRVTSDKAQPRDAVAGEEWLSVSGLTVALPAATVGVQVDDRVTVTVSADASLVGVPLYVKGVQRGTQLVLRRLRVSEVR